MTLEYIPKISLDEVYNLLPIDYQEHTNPSDIKEFDDTSNKEFVRKRFYKLKLGESEIVHLTLGKDLKKVFNKTKSFYEECPEYSCKPIFVNDGQTLNLFGQEFFEGIPIDEKYATNNNSDEDVSKIISKIQKTFSSLEVESTHEAFLEEFSEFKETILSNNSLHLFDKEFLNKCVFPYLEDSLLPKSFSVRWSPGDLAARNILVDNEHNFRIIDCEFAHQTHFHDEDWIRLAVFSSGNFKETPSLKQRLEQVDPWYHIYLPLRQTWLNRTIWQNDEYQHFASEDLHTVLKLTESFGTNNKNVSLLIHGVLDAARRSLNEISIEKDSRIQKEKELAAEKQLALSKQRKLDQEKQLRLSKQSELDAEKQLRLSKESELDAEKQLRLSKESELDAEKQLRLSKESELASEKQLRVQKENELDAEKQIRLSQESELDAEKQLRVQKESELLIREDKILRMQNSFSWKITSPLRFLRRKFIDPRIKSVHTHPKSESEENSYQDWIKKYDTITDDRITSFRKEFEDLKEKPLFSIIMPVYNPPKKFFEDALKSVISQVYTKWELCIADDRSTQAYVHEIIKKYSKNFPKIKVHINEKHSHISETSNNALKLAKGEYVVLMDHDDLLRPHSLLRFAEAISNNNKLKLIYSDEDKIDLKGLRYNPYFKPDWNPDLLLAQNYICHLTCIRKNLVNRIGNFKQGFEGSQDWDLFLRTTETLNDSEILHIPEILYHWRATDSSTATKLSNKDYALKSAIKALNEHHTRMKTCGSPEVLKNGYFKTNYCLQKKLKCSIIIPTCNGGKVLKRCLSSIYQNSDSSKFEILLIDNGSDCSDTINLFSNFQNQYQNFRIIHDNSEFNYSALNNNAVKICKNDILIFLNDDTEILTKNWLVDLMSNAVRPKVGAVGGKLLYPNGTIQHAGVILGIGGVAGHAFKTKPVNYSGHMNRSNLSHNVSAVTGACLAIEKNKFKQVEGFDELNLKIAFNDVDLCLKLMKAGYKNLFLPQVQLIHYESFSRGLENTPEKKIRFSKECNTMISRWSDILNNDPNYNMNLTKIREDFSYKL